MKLTEQTYNIGQDVNVNKYVYSKYKAEELVLEAIAHHGLNAKIMRVGNLSARQKDGQFQINFNTNNFLARLRAYVVIGMVPYEDLDRHYEFSPIDEVAHAIMLLAQTPKECIVFHPYNTHRQFLSDILTGFVLSGMKLRRVETEELAVCMNLLQIYNLFLAGVERTIQALGSIEVGRGDNEGYLIAYAIELLIIFVVHKAAHLRFELKN